MPFESAKLMKFRQENNYFGVKKCNLDKKIRPSDTQKASKTRELFSLNLLAFSYLRIILLFNTRLR